MFAALNAKQFEACFMRWMSSLCPALAGQVVSIDGKTVRGSRQRGERAIHLVAAYGSGLGMALGQVRTAEKSNEIMVIQELLDVLQLKGAIVTIDAMGCQREIAERVVQAGADYVLACKRATRAPCWSGYRRHLTPWSVCPTPIPTIQTTIAKSKRITGASKRVAAS